jgi:hypothetical protein
MMKSLSDSKLISIKSKPINKSKKKTIRFSKTCKSLSYSTHQNPIITECLERKWLPFPFQYQYLGHECCTKKKKNECFSFSNFQLIYIQRLQFLEL